MQIVFQHLPVIKSASKTDLKEQKRMMVSQHVC